MVKYEMLDFKSEGDFLDYFFQTLLETNWTYDYFVDWKKVKEYVRRYLKEISLLNTLTKVKTEEREKELKEIFMRYPETIQVIPLIIAIREKSIPIIEVGEKAFYKVFDFSQRKVREDEASELVRFCRNVGIMELFSEINDLYAYLIGVEVGLDTNARKNRSGKIFQNLVQLLLERKLRNMQNIRIKSEDRNIKTVRNKKADFVIYKHDTPRVVIECNFYSGTGSKPIETANAYIDFQRKVRERGLQFIWITDGRGWKEMKNTIIQSSKEIDFLMNYTIASEKLTKIIPLLL
ncbi:MAG: type II restriction endonuclease [Candidatus Verstraetearchaeota archaeon]|nr:type II restriction endonuclease [Candidatus Verstraetearchaeota archaeon]